jgi:hypothetical protein
MKANCTKIKNGSMDSRNVKSPILVPFESVREPASGAQSLQIKEARAALMETETT